MCSPTIATTTPIFARFVLHIVCECIVYGCVRPLIPFHGFEAIVPLCSIKSDEVKILQRVADVFYRAARRQR